MDVKLPESVVGVLRKMKNNQTNEDAINYIKLNTKDNLRSFVKSLFSYMPTEEQVNEAMKDIEKRIEKRLKECYLN